MKLDNVKPSNRVIDNTGAGPVSKAIDKVGTWFNPINGVRNMRETLIKNGTIEPPKGSPIRKGLPSRWGGK